MKYKKRSSSNVRIIGTTDNFNTTSGLTVANGRFLTPAECDGGRPVCVIGSDVATNLFLRESPLGEKIARRAASV